MKPKIFSLLVLFLIPLAARGANRPEEEQNKVDWLLTEVANSKATFIRNGKEYEAARAVEHLKFKLLFAGRRVQTARQFIVGVASRSRETGKPYEIRLAEADRCRSKNGFSNGWSSTKRANSRAGSPPRAVKPLSLFSASR